MAKAPIRHAQLDSLPISLGIRILDIGCGPGLYLPHWLEITREAAAQFTLLDRSASALKKCAQLAKDAGAEHRVKLLEKDIFCRGLPQGSFDLIFIGNTMEYLPSPSEYLKENVLPLLRSGGTLAVRDLDCGLLAVNYADPALVSKIIHARILGCQANSMNNETFHNPFIGRSLGKIVKEAGFTDISLTPYFCEFRYPLRPEQSEYLSALHTSWYVEDPCGILSEEERSQWHSFFDKKHPQCILEKESLFYVETEFLVTATK
jgi:SAM-dependent methyltransferase